MTNKNIYFHVGPGKTGTSAIQAWLQNNGPWLRTAGVLYPNHALDINHISSGNLLEVVDRDSSGKTYLNKDKCKKLLSLFNKSSAHTLLISSEFLFSHSLELLEEFPTAKIILYLRNPIELIESNYNQSVKRHSVFTPLTAIYQGVPALPFIKRMLTLFDKERVIIRPYHKQQFISKNIICDLLSSLELGELPSVEDKRINSSYQFEALEFKRLINYFPIEHLEYELDKILQQYSTGTDNYTILNSDFAQSSRSQLCKELGEFAQEYKQLHLTSFITQLEKASTLPYKPQCAQSHDLEYVAQFINQKSPELFDKIYKIIDKNRDFYIDNQHFWSWFNSIDHEKTNIEYNTNSNRIKRWLNKNSDKKSAIPERPLPAPKGINGLKRRLRLNPKMIDERVLINMAIFAFDNQEYQFSEKLLLQVLTISPFNQTALIHINKVRLMLR